MAVSDGYKAYVLEGLQAVSPLRRGLILHAVLAMSY
jgi:hypothetical protein